MGLDILYGLEQAFILEHALINNCMKPQFLLSKARNTVTGQTVKNQDLTGDRYTVNQRAICQQLADQLAAKMTERTGDLWEGYCELYTPTVRR